MYLLLICSLTFICFPLPLTQILMVKQSLVLSQLYYLGQQYMFYKDNKSSIECKDSAEQILHGRSSRESNSFIEEREQINKNEEKYSSKTQHFQKFCKKQIKDYFQCRSKYQIKLPKLFNFWNFFLNIFLGIKQKQGNVTENSCSLIQMQKINNSDITNKIYLADSIPKSKLLFLVMRVKAGKKKVHTYDIQLLDSNCKILYKKMNFQRWQEIQTQIETMKRNAQRFIMLLCNKQQLTQSISKNGEFYNWILHFDDFDQFAKNQESVKIKDLITSEQQRNDKDEQYVQSLEKSFEKYTFIKQSLQHNRSMHLNSINATAQEMSLQALIHNILIRVITRTDVSFNQQVTMYRQTIVQITKKLYLKQLAKEKNRNDHHFPSNLENAHQCCRCKSKRGYIYCPTCSLSQGKNISLCLQCYAPYHSETINKKPISEQERAVNSLNKWRKVDYYVDGLIDPRTGNKKIKLENI